MQLSIVCTALGLNRNGCIYYTATGFPNNRDRFAANPCIPFDLQNETLLETWRPALLIQPETHINHLIVTNPLVNGTDHRFSIHTFVSDGVSTTLSPLPLPIFTYKINQEKR